METGKRKRIMVGLASILLGCVLCLLVTPFGFRLTFNTLNLSYIETKTSIKLPIGLSEVDTFDNGEFFVVAHIRLPEYAIDQFKSENEFGSLKFIFPSPLATLDIYSDVLDPNNRDLPEDADWLGLTGRTENNRWEAILDKKSGRLWIIVFYPDMSGDLH